MDPQLRSLLEAGLRVSATMRRLVAELEESDLIVHVIGGHSRSDGTSGALMFVTGVGSHRFVRISVDDRLGPTRLVALLGHELQHAVEVSRAQWVIDQPSFGRLYEHIGIRSCHGALHVCYETDAARVATQLVLNELRQARMATTEAGLR